MKKKLTLIASKMKKLLLAAIILPIFVGCEDTAALQGMVEREINAFLQNNPGILQHNELLNIEPITHGDRHDNGLLTGSTNVRFRSRRTGSVQIAAFGFMHNKNNGSMRIFAINHPLVMGLNGGRF